MKETQSDFVFHFRRNSSRYSFSQDRKGDSSCNVQLKRASWSSFPHLKLSTAEEKTQIMEAKTSSKCRSSENLKKPHKLVKSKSTSFFKTTSSFKNFFASAFSSTHSSSAASVVSVASSASSCSSSSIPSSPKTRSSWSSGVTHILERERSNHYKDDNYEIVGTAPQQFSNGLHIRNGSVHVTASLLEEEEEDDEMIMNTPKIICAHKKTPDVERKTRRQIAQELELMRQLGKLPGDGGRQETYEEKNDGSFYENFSSLRNLKGYKPTLDIKNHNKSMEETLNEINLQHSDFYTNNAIDDGALYSTKINCSVGRSKSLNVNSENIDKSVKRISLSTPQEGTSDKIESIGESYQDTITYNPLVNVESNISQNIPSANNRSERNVIFDMLNYTGVTDLTDDDSDYDSSDVMMNIDDESSSFEKCLEDNLEKLCDKDNYSRENSTFSVYSLKENFSLDNSEESSSITKESSKDPFDLQTQNVMKETYQTTKSVGQTLQSDIDDQCSRNIVNSFTEKHNEGNSTVESFSSDRCLSESGDTKCSTNESDNVRSKVCDDAKDVAEEGKVQLRKKHRPNLQLDLGKTQVHKVLSNEKVLRRITENEIDFGAKSPKTPKSPAIDIDECFKERQQKLKDSPKDNLTKVKDLTQRLRLPLEQPTYLQWLNIPNKGSAQKRTEVISPTVVTISVEGQFRLHENVTKATEEQRSKNITNALLWIKDELVKMKQQDQQLACQLVHLQLEMQRMRLVRSCTQHEALLEEVTCEEEEQKAYMTSADLYDPPNSLRECAPSVLRDIGVTRMNIASRRFTLR